MGTIFFSETNNNLKLETEYQDKCQVNNNLDATNRYEIKDNQPESKFIQKRKCRCGKRK